jgi:hypothetical protein
MKCVKMSARLVDLIHSAKSLGANMRTVLLIFCCAGPDYITKARKKLSSRNLTTKISTSSLLDSIIYFIQDRKNSIDSDPEICVCKCKL